LIVLCYFKTSGITECHKLQFFTYCSRVLRKKLGIRVRGAEGGSMVRRAVPSATTGIIRGTPVREASSAMPVLALGAGSPAPGWERLQSQVVHAGP